MSGQTNQVPLPPKSAQRAQRKLHPAFEEILQSSRQHLQASRGHLDAASQSASRPQVQPSIPIAAADTLSPPPTRVSGLVRYVDNVLQGFLRSPPPPSPAPHGMASSPISPLGQAGSPRSSPQRKSLIQDLMSMHTNELHNADAMLVDGLGGAMTRPSSVFSRAQRSPQAQHHSRRADLEASTGSVEKEKVPSPTPHRVRVERGNTMDAALARAFVSWKRESLASDVSNISYYEADHVRDPSQPNRSPGIAERRRSKQMRGLAHPQFRMEVDDVDGHQQIGEKGSFSPDAINSVPKSAHSVYSQSAYSNGSSADETVDASEVHHVQRYSTRPLVGGQPQAIHRPVSKDISPSDTDEHCGDSSLVSYCDDDEYDLDNLPEEFISRIPPDVSIIQAIKDAVQHGIVPPEFGKRQRSPGDKTFSAPCSEQTAEDDEYDLENLPQAFVSRIPPGITKVQAIRYAVRNGLVPADFGKKSRDGRPLGPLGFVLPKGMTKEEVVAMALQNGIHPPGLAINKNVVTWSGPLSPSNPRNWPQRKKWATTATVALSTFVSNMASSMVAPLIPLLRRQIQGLTEEQVEENSVDFETSLVLSCYILAFAFAPFVYGPCSELFGRRRLLQGGIVVFLFFNIFCGLAESLPTLVALRFFAALGAAAPMTIGGGCITDMFAPRQRTTPMLFYGIAPLVGPVIGPVISGIVSDRSHKWQPVFWAASVVIAVVALMVMFLPESYVPTILEAKAERLRRETNNPDLVTIFDLQQESLSHRFGRYLIRPLVLLFTQPIMMLLALLTAISFGQVYLLFAVLPSVHTKFYQESVVTGSLHFLSFGIGFIVGALFGIGVIDRIHEWLTLRNDGVPCAEFKLVPMVAVSPLAPVALLAFGWATQNRAHWIVGDLACFWFAFSVSASFLSVQGYLIDTFALLAGSALTATVVTRSLLGFVFTLFTASLVQAIRIDYAFTLMAGLFALVGFPVSFILMRYGPRMRERSPYARG
ncbi:hypothetical protein A4X09_0g1687 [Tilletia walkeri]|uniref:Major facilitator superfamily (MFS) profile domain-containing protein n=1 Tax=Tilletia walkeri TaxID=117179 RepID=A0A8X7NDS7_9BASI|nr:hypothetical protein A4X09_0g1687 [Tilletia walkeri]